MKTILVAEDNDSNYLLMTYILKKYYQVQRAKNGKEAVERVDQGDIDLVLMDIKMPVMDGLEATAKIREKHTDVPIVALTANAFASDRQMAMEVGCNEFLSKPVSSAKCLEVISKLIGMVVLLFCMLLPMNSVAANVKKTVAQVKDTVTITENWDYIVSGTTPFADSSCVDIANTEHAVLILNQVKPSAAIKLLAKYVKINGAKAVNNTNCQVKLYNLGCIILPYGNSTKPLTVYPERDFGGEGVDNFGLGNTGGYMNTLKAEQLNNKIRSFKLKRGYMVTFSTLPEGRGYSRCFIAAYNDLEIAELPVVLDQKISSYRIFKWYDAGKRQLASAAGDKTLLAALNVQSSYDWGQGNSSLLPDYEWVPNHIYEDWPSSATIGGTTQSPHTKTNNEPFNSSDDHPQDLNTILDNWENMMRTGLRLCSPASHDGALGKHHEFLDSIDARGWRCDIIDLHCYWNEWNFSNSIKGDWVDRHHRPVWISEWVWGSSWGNNGIFAEATGSNRDNPTQAQLNKNKEVVERICKALNGFDYIERYYYWNSEANCSKLYYGGKRTAAGEMYAKLNSGLAYNGKYDYVPNTPRQYGLSKFKVTTSNGVNTITWYDKNGEYNQLMELQRKLKGGQWTTLSLIEQKESAANYSYKDEGAPEDAKYRVRLIDLNGVERYTNDDLETGDAIVAEDGRTMYVGGNLLVNGDFDFGTEGWTSGTGAAIGQPYFEVVPTGGYGNGSYLQAYGDGDIKHAGSLRTAVDIQAGADYYFRVASCNGGAYQCVSLTEDGTTEAKNVLKLANSSEWQVQSGVFNSGTYKQALIAFRWLGANAQIDKLELRRLFDTYEAAVADAAVTDEAYAAAKAKHDETVRQHYLDSLAVIDAALKTMQFPLDAEAFTELTLVSSPKVPKQPNLKESTGWNVKAGTYKGGDQRTNTVGGKTCWNAWWSGISASVGEKQTMEINQDVTGLPEGAYIMECKATTQHYCISDQHGFLVSDGVTATTPVMQADYFDLPVSNIWQTLTTAPVYVKEGGTVNVGFKSSKKGAIDNAWREIGNKKATGDKREGWWCATEFRLRYLPAFTATAGAGWGTICLPREMIKPNGMTFYKVAGVTADYTQLCLEEVAEPETATPYIYKTTEEQPRFFMTGTAKTSATAGDNNLRGYLTATKAPAGSYLLTDGRWTKVEDAQTNVAAYSALITTLDGQVVYENWTGVTMPIGDVAGAIEAVAAEGQPAAHYTLGGRRTAHPRGVVIKKDGRQTRKVIKR